MAVGTVMAVKKVTTHLNKRQVMKAVKGAVKEPEEKAALLVEREAKISMKSGGGSSRTPSDAGDPPNVQSGNLRSSIKIGYDKMKEAFFVGPTFQAWYGRLHEQPGKSVSAGTVTEFGGRNFPQRPFMRPALLKVMKQFKRLFKNIKLRKNL